MLNLLFYIYTTLLLQQNHKQPAKEFNWGKEIKGFTNQGFITEKLANYSLKTYRKMATFVASGSPIEKPGLLSHVPKRFQGSYKAVPKVDWLQLLQNDFGHPDWK
jgi:hypothetical protein